MGELTETMIVDLADEIAVTVMESMALSRFGISHGVLENLKHNSKAGEINQKILRRWAYKNPKDQVPVK